MGYIYIYICDYIWIYMDIMYDISRYIRSQTAWLIGDLLLGIFHGKKFWVTSMFHKLGGSGKIKHGWQWEISELAMEVEFAGRIIELGISQAMLITGWYVFVFCSVVLCCLSSKFNPKYRYLLFTGSTCVRYFSTLIFCYPCTNQHPW